MAATFLRVRTLLPLVGGAVLAAFSWQCDNGAGGVDACRDIEQHRCEVARGCPNFGLDSDDDVAECRLFYRDQCLFGIADAVSPADADVAGCLAALDQASDCREAESLAACSNPPPLAETADASAITGCQALLTPEVLGGCWFLAPPPPAEEGGGGAGGEPAAGGAGGTGGG